MTTRALGQRLWSRLARLAPSIGTASTGNGFPEDLIAVHSSTATDTETPAVRESQSRGLTDNERVMALQLATDLRFSDATILREALTHRSYLNEINQAWPSNERLEFLGDAVLGVITTDFLFHRFGHMSEGDLTNLRSALVRTETLARFAQQIRLGRYLFLGRGEELNSGRKRPGGLACAFEALVGGIYIDQGYDAARAFAMRFIEPEITAVVDGHLHQNPKSMLQEIVQARMQQTPTYHVIEVDGPDHAKAFTVEVRAGADVLGRAQDRSKRSAEQLAAERGLAHVQALALLKPETARA